MWKLGEYWSSFENSCFVLPVAYRLCVVWPSPLVFRRLLWSLTAPFLANWMFIIRSIVHVFLLSEKSHPNESFCPSFLTHDTCILCSSYTCVQERVINIFLKFSEKGWINEYISIPESASFAYKEIKHMLTTVVPSSQKFVLTYVVLVINFLAAILVNRVTLLRWLCLLRVAELCWQFDWGLAHCACSSRLLQSWFQLRCCAVRGLSWDERELLRNEMQLLQVRQIRRDVCCKQQFVLWRVPSLALAWQ